MIDFERGQGATEYLLMLAAVLVVVAAAVYFMMGTGPSFMVTPAAGYPEMADNEEAVIFTVDSVTPTQVTADFEVLDNTGSSIGTKDSVSIKSGTTVIVGTDSTVTPGSTLKVSAEGSTKTFDITT